MDYSLFDTLLDAVLVIDEQRKILYCNEAVSTLSGIPLKRIKKTTLCYEIFEFEDVDLFCMPNGTWGKDHASPYRELHFKTPATDKTSRVLVTIQPDPHEKNRWILYLRDMTLEEALQKKYRSELGKKEEVIVDLKKAQAELEDYSKNLEKKVEQRTAELHDANQILNAMLNSLGQGFLVFRKDGMCIPIYSKACEVILETNPALKYIWEILKIPAAEIESFKIWVTTLFQEPIPFKDLAELGSVTFPHSKNKYITLEYYPMRSAAEHSIRNKAGKVEGVVLVSSDKSQEHKAQMDAEREKAYANMVTKLVKSKDQFLLFVKESRVLFQKAYQMLQTQPEHLQDGNVKNCNIDVEFILRFLHTLKGTSAYFSMEVLKNLAHEYEDEYSNLPDLSTVELKKQAPLLEKRIQELGKVFEGFLKENQNLIGTALQDGERRIEISEMDLKIFCKKLSQLPPPFQNLKTEYIEQFIQEPIQKYFEHFEDVAFQVASKLGKQIKPFIFSGGGLRVVGEYYSEVFNSLIHAFRNAVDHGIEMPEDRIDLGKDAAGLIEISFKKLVKGGSTLDSTKDSTNWIEILIKDDGGGIDPKIIREKLKGKIPAIESENDSTVIQHIFDSGFSTQETVNDISGRGIGMGAILHAAKALGGTAFVNSTVGKGSILSIVIPEIHA